MPNVSSLTPTLSSASSPGAATSSAHGAVPSLLNPILGREEEVERILRHLDRDDLRLLTLLGPGGVGKTRLALEVMRRAGGDFAHGARFVSLAPMREHALVPFAVAQALGIQQSGALPVTDVLTAWLGPRHLLLALDNMEQVIAAASPWLADLLASCPRLTVLATSRIALNITGEHRYRVPPLPVPDSSATDRLDAYASVALFGQRARAVRSDFALDAVNSGAIAEICTRLDGLPLAIELAAARVNVFSPAEILARLTDRLTLLTGHVRDAPPRLRSLRDAIGWSYDLLTSEEREFHARLSVFVGGFSLEAATHMASQAQGYADQPDTADRIGALIDQSLVERVDGASGTRFRMLETIREYGLAYLAEQGQLDAAHDAHAAYYGQMAVQAEEGLKGPDQARWLDRLEDEHGNLREAMAWLTAQNRVPAAIELFSNIIHFMHVRAHFTEWGQLLDGWFALPELGHRTRTRALALFASGLRTASLGEPVPAIRSLGEALELFRELADPKNILFSLNVLSFAYWTASDMDHARVANDEWMPMATHLGDTRSQALALYVLANIVWYEGDLERARQLFEEALAVARRAGDQWVTGMALGTLGRLTLDLGGKTSDAETLLNEAQIIQEELGDRRNLPVGYNNLAIIARIQGNLDAAESHIQAGMAIAQATGQVIAEADCHLESGIVARLRGELERSVRELQQAVRLFQPTRDAPDIAECLKAFAATAFAAGDALATACFLGGADALLRDIEPLPHTTRFVDEHGRLMDSVRAVLGQAAFDRAHAEADGWSMDDAVTAALAFDPGEGQPEQTGLVHGLSPRELDVLRLMANGLTNQQIADELFLSRRTVTSHVASILGKLDLSSRTAAAAFAIRGGIA